MEAMKFYGWTWDELMSTPITGFWTCRRDMERLRCADRLEKFQLMCLDKSEEQSRRSWFDQQVAGIGTVVVEDHPFDPEGFNTLKTLSQ
jgi:hypothetical protein